MTSVLLHTIVSGLVGAAGLLAIVFALVRGRKVGAGIPFALGGLGFVIYGGLFWLTQSVARFTEMLEVATTTSGGDAGERVETLKQILTLINPTALIEPIALLLLMVGFGALARAADAKRHAAGAVPAQGDAPDAGGA